MGLVESEESALVGLLIHEVKRNLVISMAVEVEDCELVQSRLQGDHLLLAYHADWVDRVAEFVLEEHSSSGINMDKCVGAYADHRQKDEGLIGCR